MDARVCRIRVPGSSGCSTLSRISSGLSSGSPPLSGSPPFSSRGLSGEFRGPNGGLDGELRSAVDADDPEWCRLWISLKWIQGVEPESSGVSWGGLLEVCGVSLNQVIQLPDPAGWLVVQELRVVCVPSVVVSDMIGS